MAEKKITYAPQNGALDSLVETLVQARMSYELGEPSISDAEYDALEDRLRALDPAHPFLAKVGSTSSTGGPKVKHASPMLSLNKTYDAQELEHWRADRELLGTWKVDGVSLSLVYQKGKLVQAKTRGDGYEGEDVSAKALWVPSIPRQLDQELDIEVRGELCCRTSAFARLSEEMLKWGLERPQSERNIVAGLLGRKSLSALTRYFDFLAFELIGLGEHLKTEEAKFEQLRKLNFRSPRYQKLQSLEQVEVFLEEVKEELLDSDLGLDGAVFSFNDLSLHETMGATAHHPRFKMSFKWQGQTATTTIKDIRWYTSRLGIVTPVALVDAVSLSGAQIQNVSLHNAAHVEAHQLKIGDEIEIVRSGEVIPKFLRVINPKSGHKAWIDVCPSCAASLVYDKLRLKCPATQSCPAQQLGVILHWIKTTQIDDLSEKRLEQMMAKGLVKNLTDLYELSINDLLSLPNTKDKLALKLHQNIQKSKDLTLARFLAALGIEGGGLTTWEALIEHYPSLAEIRALTTEQISFIHGFAEKSAELIVRGLGDKGPIIDLLLSKGLRIQAVAPKPKTANQHSLKDLQLVITGALSRPRGDYEELLKSVGAKISASVSKKTHALVCNETDATSSKYKKALELKIPIWDEAKLIAMLGS